MITISKIKKKVGKNSNKVKYVTDLSVFSFVGFLPAALVYCALSNLNRNKNFA
jgi:hypothetical protein